MQHLIRVYTVCHSSSSLQTHLVENSTCSNFKSKSFDKELRCLNTKGKYGKVSDRNQMLNYKQICNNNHFYGIYRSINQLSDCVSLTKSVGTELKGFVGQSF